MNQKMYAVIEDPQNSKPVLQQMIKAFQEGSDPKEFLDGVFSAQQEVRGILKDVAIPELPEEAADIQSAISDLTSQIAELQGELNELSKPRNEAMQTVDKQIAAVEYGNLVVRKLGSTTGTGIRSGRRGRSVTLTNSEGERHFPSFSEARRVIHLEKLGVEPNSPASAMNCTAFLEKMGYAVTED